MPRLKGQLDGGTIGYNIPMEKLEEVKSGKYIKGQPSGIKMSSSDYWAWKQSKKMKSIKGQLS